MPTPVGHALGGAIVALALGAGAAGRAGKGMWQMSSGNLRNSHPPYQPHLPYLPCAIAACLPDLDFLWGRHNMETHSVGFAALIGLLVFAWRRDARLALACALAACSHVLFDWLGSDDFPPLGVMALWPLTSQFYFADAFIFEAISRRYWLPGFVQHNVLAVLREIAILGPIAGALWWWRVKRKGHRDTETRRNTTKEIYD
jgi:membrane-bound metal-dependent hydrolase YbcI (DUF457 family)